MSLFKSREWWSVNLNETEMYDSQSLLILSLGSDSNQYVLLGNHEGLLRLYSPSSEIIDDGVTGYQPSHLLLEVQLSSPILQVGEGILVSGSPDKYLAILHPRLFSVYGLKKRESKETTVGDQMVIELAYQHILRHSAHSFVIGPFGGVRGRSFICIQSLDGLLSFYEQESFAFQLYQPSFVLPFNFAYLEKIDSFLFLNAFLIFNCYSYESLASAASSNDKKISSSWSFNLGESVVDIKTVKRNGLVIVVLSERNLYGLSEHGKLIFMKRLEYKPVAICSFVIEEDKKLMNVIVTDGNCLNLYEETNLKWSMKLDLTPVSVNRIFLNNLPGGIVLLSEDGYLQVAYIGTHPSVYIVPPFVQPEIDFQKAEIEMKKLQEKIAANDTADPVTTDLLTVELKIDKNLKTDDGVKKCYVTIEINPQCPVNKVQVLVVVEPPLTATNSDLMMKTCCEKTFVESCVFLNRTGVVSNLTLEVIVTYLVNDRIARCEQKSGVLPLGLVVEETPPVKEAEHKLTVCTNKPVCGMNQLFRDFSTEEGSPNVIGFKFLNSGEVVTILAAKSSQRYRLQSDAAAAVSLFLSILIERLKIYFRKDSDFTLTYSSSIPLDVFFGQVQIHHELISKGKQLEKKLLQESSQFRTIQKKILSILKDVTPKPASNLHKILKDTSRMIMGSLDELEKLDEELFLSRCNIRSLCRILVNLLELMGVGEKDLRLLKLVFNPNVYDAENQGWLEVQEAAASFLLRTTLAKSTRDQQKPTDISLNPLSDVTKMTKHFSSVIDRVTKGTHLIERSEFESRKEPLPTIRTGHDSEETFFDEEIPTSTKYLDLKKLNDKKSEQSAPVKNDQAKVTIQRNIQREDKEVKIVEEEKKDNADSVKNFEVSPDTTKEMNTKRGIEKEEIQPEKKTEEETIQKDEEDKVDGKELGKVQEEKKMEGDSGGDDVDYDDDDAIWDVKVGEMRI